MKKMKKLIILLILFAIVSSGGCESQKNTEKDLAKVYYDKGRDIMNNRQRGDEIENFSKAINIYPEYEEAYFFRAISYMKLGYHFKGGGNVYQDAIKDFDKLIELNPSSYEAYVNRGNAYLLLGDYKKASDNYSYSINSICSKRPEAYYGWAMLHIMEGKLNPARLSLGIVGQFSYDDGYFLKSENCD